uniref:Vacuolar protein sorting-associated protein 11 homolog n=1 Tax=Kalanchoe fedtschenkoi TaxID=63787 RepID=A0A7N0RJ98_KALFE
MHQWRRFDFFEEKCARKCTIPEDVTGTITCCSGGRGRVVVGCDDGTVSLLDRGLKYSYGFQAHSSSVHFLQQLKITSFIVSEEAPPKSLMAIGLNNGCIYCIKGDITRKRITRFKLQISDPDESSITGLGFCKDGQGLVLLFAVSPNSVSLFNFQSHPPRLQILDQIGSTVNSVTMSDRSELIIGRPEAVYFYEVDGRGPCWAFEGEKKFLGWFHGNLLCVIPDRRNGKDTFYIYDLKNRLIAHSVAVNEVSHLLCEWGNIVLIMTDKSALCIGEKDIESKQDMLAQSQQADAAATSEVLRKYGDHLYSKREYDEAMAQYVLTIGHLEPSYVVQKFLDAQGIHNLTDYLEKLQEKGLASKDQTTLLLKCYIKLKDDEKLNVFIKSEDGIGEHEFDVETAIRVCCAANYHEQAMYVARKAGRHELYLKFLLDDLGSYDEALQYISSLEPSQSGVAIIEFGEILMEHKPAETVEILMRLCTEEGDSSKKESSNETYLPSPFDFLDIFVHHRQHLMDFLEEYTNKVKDPPAKKDVHNTLLELYFSNDLNFPDSLAQLSFSDGPEAQSDETLLAIGEGSTKSKDREESYQKGLRLLKSAWPSGQETPQYDAGLAVFLCEMNNFMEGVLYLYEKLKLYKEVMACYMQAHDHEGLIAFCKRLGDSGEGGDPTLWADLLKYFGELGEDCTKEVKEVLAYIERDDILPPTVFLEALSRNPCLTVSVVED